MGGSSLSNVEFVYINPDEIISTLPLIQSDLIRGVEQTDCYALIDIIEELQNETMFCILVMVDGEYKATVVFNTNIYPRKKYLNVVIVAGEELELWNTEMNDCLDDLARTLGLDGVSAYCRMGWKKKLRADDMKIYMTRNV